MLQHVLGGRRPFTVVPILVTSFHEMILARRSPADDPRVARFIEALRTTLAEDDVPTALIAGVDFAHVGHKFGDAEGLAADFLATTEEKDRRLIAALEAADAERFFREVAADGDRTPDLRLRADVHPAVARRRRARVGCCTTSAAPTSRRSPRSATRVCAYSDG